jgi:hypothetical protein
MAGALHTELVRPHLRRLNMVLLALGVMAGTIWTGVLVADPAEPWTERTEPMSVVILDAGGALAGTLTLTASVLGALLIGCSGWLWAYPRVSASLQRSALRASWATLASGLVTATQLAGYPLVRAVLAPSSLAWPAVITFTGLTLAVTRCCSARCGGSPRRSRASWVPGSGWVVRAWRVGVEQCGPLFRYVG